MLSWWLRFFWAYLKGELGRYILCGIIATSVDSGIFAWMYYHEKWSYLEANSVSFGTAVVINYFISVTWVFRGYKRKQLLIESLCFFGISLGSFICSYLAMRWVGDFNVPLAKCLAIMFSAIFNFSLKKLILFSNFKRPL